MKMLAALSGLAVAIAAAAIAAASAADTRFPTRPLRVVLPSAPGGGPDIIGRGIAPAMSELLGQPLIVDNRPGAGGRIAVELVARAQPDGHTLLIGNSATNGVQPAAFASSGRIDPTKALRGVSRLATINTILVSGSTFPPNNLKELVTYALARPGQLNFSSTLGSTAHLDMLAFAARSGMKILNVPSKGAGAAVIAMIAGEIHFSFINAATALPQVRGGRMKAFAVAADARLPEAPSVPTLAEAGYPGIGSPFWNGLFVPVNTPQGIVNRLHAAVLDAVRRPDVKELLAKSFVPITASTSPAEFDAFVRGETRRLGQIIRDNDVKFD